MGSGSQTLAVDCPPPTLASCEPIRVKQLLFNSCEPFFGLNRAGVAKEERRRRLTPATRKVWGEITR